MSTTRVVHVDDKVSGAVYIGRGSFRKHLKPSFWGNPYKIGKDGTREEVVQKYFDFLDFAYMTDQPEGIHDRLKALVGKPLACHCRHDGEKQTSENLCHGDAIIDYLRYAGLEGRDEAGEA